ncbi:D-aminoacyl-tRNA deacylase [Aquicella lusitana]|uniref:D-aminoacyl-tRNA deacylase n=1 Tax=Aquicella lusitana TaxID=254246 RepID=A0A370GNC4_9COXI|nr:D-aminoacyl-tRNA deacylase [Aquicella lusitana]RDI45228.1 D-tyrosyl-tRNA(Tyr) deacylase [Aquicella lusitana]VVC72702.1 D-aminoacyl-tRNA deacylase [Aquicella lusitana]
MLGLIQRVSHADVRVTGHTVGTIGLGILALIGVEKTDTSQEAEKLFQRILQYRIFPDAAGRMNLSLQDIQGGLLLVPQFTLVAETHKGTRPGFSRGMPPEEGKKLFAYLVEHARAHYPHVAAGQFGAYMQVSLCNDGPVTFLLHT